MLDSCKNMKEVNETFISEQSNLFDKHGVFFAFSKDQINEGLEKIGFERGKHKLRAIGGGAYCFSHTFDAFDKEHDALIVAKHEATKRLRTPEQIILAALNNFECFYTGDIEDAYESELKGMGYSLEQCWKVYHDNSY